VNELFVLKGESRPPLLLNSPL